VRQDRVTPLTALWHHGDDIDRLREADDGLHRLATPGGDGQPWAAYRGHLEVTLREWSDRLQRGASHASPVARVYIPKPNGRQWPKGSSPGREMASAAVVSCESTCPPKDQYRRLCLKLRGHFQDYGIRGNFRWLDEVRRYAEEAWRYWLSRRRSKNAIGWETFPRRLQAYVLPTPKIVHTI
jgi:hypothetical protein